jgi:DNA-directed RNA polymerase subunit RPC12/RpoP
MNENNPFKDREDERRCRCVWCMARFMEGDIKVDDDYTECCPYCGARGFIQDEEN